MEKIIFNCELLTNVVIKSTSATEGITISLDFIPGAKFLGIAAKKLYDEKNPKQTMDLFHNGKVSFGDAHLAMDGKKSIKAPFSWFVNKGENINNTIYIHHNLDSEYKKKLASNGVQLKQVRTVYFTCEKFGSIVSEFSLKSAYDREKRKAQDSQMYGYFSIPKGSKWQFEVRTPKEYVQIIIDALVGKNRLGKSKNSEYGLVEISHQNTELIKDEIKLDKGINVLYAESNLCFYNDFGVTTLQPVVEQLGFDAGAKILWDQSQIRARKYQTWNTKRYNRDADRMIIEKGSVFVIDTSNCTSNRYENKLIGSHVSEGFGTVLINPSFLNKNDKEINLNLSKYEGEVILPAFYENGEKDEMIIKAINKIADLSTVENDIDKKVNDFIKQKLDVFKGRKAIKSSQWGQIRNIAKFCKDYNEFKNFVFDELNGFVNYGQNQDSWKTKNRKWVLEKFLNETEKTYVLELIQKLASEMAKNSK